MTQNMIIFILGDSMKKYIKEYISECEVLLRGKIDKDMVRNHYRKICFFQHERLIHLIVTLSVFVFAILFIILSFDSIKFLIPSAALLIMGIFYIVHYYFLENSVQYLYIIYDEMKKKVK